MLTAKHQQRIDELRKYALPITFSSMDIRAAAPVDDSGEPATEMLIKGYACIWNIPDDYGTVWIKGAFAKSISERGPDSKSKYKIVMLWQHDVCDPIGRITVLKEDDIGLYFECILDDVDNGERAYDQIQSGTLNQFSFGFNYVWEMITYNETLDVLEVREAILMEISVVTIGSQVETYAIRMFRSNDSALIELNNKMESLIKSIPNNRQLEFRQTITDLIALRTAGPQETRANALRTTGPQQEQIDYTHLLQNFKL